MHSRGCVVATAACIGIFCELIRKVPAVHSSGFATGFTTRLVDAKSGQTVRLHHGAHFRYLQIYTGSKAGGGEDAVVLEPLSAMSDAFNNHDGLHVISAGESLTTAIESKM